MKRIQSKLVIKRILCLGTERKFRAHNKLSSFIVEMLERLILIFFSLTTKNFAD